MDDYLLKPEDYGLTVYCSHCCQDRVFWQIYDKREGHPYRCSVCNHDLIPWTRKNRRKFKRK